MSGIGIDWRMWLACGWLFASAGCGSSVAHVSGSVSSGGQPLSGVQIVFETDEEPKQSYYGASFDDGKYILDLADRPGLAPGLYTIKATDWVQRDGSRLPAGEQGEALKSAGKAIGRAYVFQRELAAGSQTIDLALDKADRVETLPSGQ